MAVLSGGVVTSLDGWSDTTRQHGAVAAYQASESLRLLDANATFAAIYRSQVWVATLVDKVAGATARLPFKTFERTSAGREATDGSAFGALMRRPCPRHGRFFFQAWSAAMVELYGEAMWIKVRDPQTGLPVALWPMHPALLIVERNAAGERVYVHRQHTNRTHRLEWSQDDVVHVKRFNPASLERGFSRLEPLRRTLLSEDAVQAAQESFWRRGARPSVLLKHPKTLGIEAGARLREQWAGLHGGAGNWGKTAVLEEGVEAQVVQLSSSEMQMIEQRKVSREEACSIFDVPPPVVHILDRATFSNITEQMRSMYRDSMAPRLGMTESVVDEQLAAEFSDTAYGRYSLDEVLRGDPEKRAESYQRGIYSGYYTPAEVRRWEDLEPHGPESEQLYMSAAMLPIQAAAAAQAPNRGAPTVRGLRTAQGRLGRASGLGDVEVHALTKGLDEPTARAVALHLSHAVSRGDDLSGLRAALADELAHTDPEAHP